MSQPTLAVTPNTRTDGAVSRGRPVVVYAAAVGAGFVALNLVVYLGWLVAGHHSAAPVGPDPVPRSAKIGVWVFQIASCCLAIAAVAYVIRQSLRDRRLTFDAMVVLGWVLAEWQDPLVNFIKPAFFYNAYFVNVGSWASQIPGWSSPRGGWLPEDLIGTAGVGYLWFVFVLVSDCALMRAARRRWPTIGPVGLFAVAFCVGGVFDFVVELYCVHLHLWSYPGAVHSLSIFGNTINQFPIYETLAWGSVWSSLALLRFYRDENGHSIVERGIDRLAIGTTAKATMQTLAVVAAINVVFLIYSVFMIWTTLLPGTSTPHGYPSYLRAGVCGTGTPYPCPTEHSPIAVRGQLTR